VFVLCRHSFHIHCSRRPTFLPYQQHISVFKNAYLYCSFSTVRYSMWHHEDWWRLLTAAETWRWYIAIVKLDHVKVGVVNTVGVIHIKIINGVRLFSEIGHALKWDGVHYKQKVVNTAMNHLCCWIHLFWQQFMNKEVL